MAGIRRRRGTRSLTGLALLVGAGCEGVELTRPVDPPLRGLEQAAVVVACALVVVVGAALALHRPGRPPASVPCSIGAAGFAAIGVALLVAVVVDLAAAVRIEDLGCVSQPPPGPETILQLPCTPGDPVWRLALITAVVGASAAVGLLGAARLALDGFVPELLALLAAMLGGALLYVGFGPVHGAGRAVPLVTSAVFLTVAGCLGWASIRRA